MNKQSGEGAESGEGLRKQVGDAEWVVYRVGDEAGFLDTSKAYIWDAHVKRMEEGGTPLSLTLLARGLTREQAKQFVELTKESTE